MKKIIITFLILIAIFLMWQIMNVTTGECTESFPVETKEIVAIPDTPPPVTYTSLGVPNINSYMKTWMHYEKITSVNSPQYKFVRKWGWTDSEGFMRCNGEHDLGITDDYYLIALGSYYGTTIGTKYRITTNTGNVFYGALAECKANIHTNSTNQYVIKNHNIVEFLINENMLNKNVKRDGSANVYMPLNGAITKIERIDFH